MKMHSHKFSFSDASRFWNLACLPTEPLLLKKWLLIKINKNKSKESKKYSSYQLFLRKPYKIIQVTAMRKKQCMLLQKALTSIIPMLDLNKLSLGLEIQLCASLTLQSSLHTARPLPNLRAKPRDVGEFLLEISKSCLKIQFWGTCSGESCLKRWKHDLQWSLPTLPILCSGPSCDEDFGNPHSDSQCLQESTISLPIGISEL